ncbi:MAG: thiol:disulfide interchange protein DsbA [Candidatus Azotimanducaceae bacterium]|jgi:thiol:disulfide interchange protein DsbA
MMNTIIAPVKTLALLWAMSLTLLAQAESSAQIDQYEEGTHYVELPVPIKTKNPAKVEVTEYFSYGCNHCYAFDPLLNAWESELSDDVVFSRTPAIWNKTYQLFAQTYYTAQALKVGEKIHAPLFDAIHRERRRLNDPKLIAEFFGEYGVDPEEFARTFSSFGVRASTQQAEARGRAYRSSGVPALIVNGKYRIEGGMAGGNTEMIRVANFLIEKERKLIASKS